MLAWRNIAPNEIVAPSQRGRGFYHVAITPSGRYALRMRQPSNALRVLGDRLVSLGIFDTPVDAMAAADAYDEMGRKMWLQMMLQNLGPNPGYWSRATNATRSRG